MLNVLCVLIGRTVIGDSIVHTMSHQRSHLLLRGERGSHVTCCLHRYCIIKGGNYYRNYCTSIGDTLFIGGCGRFFEGTAEHMFHALCEVLSSLPADTVCSAHMSY